MRSTRESSDGPVVTIRAGSQMEMLLRLPRLRDCLDGVFDEVDAQAVPKRRSTANRRWRFAQAGVRS
jgi:hypothetical protein